MAGTITISGSAASLESGAKVIGPITITGSATIGEILDVSLASGDNTIAVPLGATAVVIVPPASSSVVLKLRTSLNSGDAGLPIAPGITATGEPTGIVYPFPSTAPTSLIINAAGTVSGFVELTFI